MNQEREKYTEPLTLAYSHRLADEQFAGFFARKNVIEVRQVVLPHAANAHSLCRYQQAEKKKEHINRLINIFYEMY